MCVVAARNKRTARPAATFVRDRGRIRLNLIGMARSLRFGGSLLLVLVVGCSVAPATLPAQPATAAQVVAPTPEPTATEAPAPIATVAPVPTRVVLPPAPTEAP